MRIVAIDPGLTIGVASVWIAGGVVQPLATETFETANPLDIGCLLHVADAGATHVVVEAFPGGGPRTKEAIHTLKVLGFVEYYARTLGLPVALRQPQQRKHKLLDARTLLPNGSPHAIDALAHALSFAGTLAFPPVMAHYGDTDRPRRDHGMSRAVG